jgi:hypothetical protein
MIPEHVSITYCKTCEHPIHNLAGGAATRLCLSGCKHDGSQSNDRPIIVVTYWRLADQRPNPNSTQESVPF